MTFRHPFKSLILHNRSSTGKSVFTCFLVDVFWCIVDKNNKKPVNRAEKNDECRQKREKNMNLFVRINNNKKMRIRSVDRAFVMSSKWLLAHVGKFSLIHIEKNTMYKEGAKRLLLIVSSSDDISLGKTMLAADIGYHRCCYSAFRWKIEKRNFEKEDVDLWSDFAQLIENHILTKKEAYSLSYLTKLYNELNDISGVSKVYRSTDVRNRIVDTFHDKLKFSKINKSKSEYVHSSNSLPQISNTDDEKSQLSKSIVLRKAAKIVHESIIHTRTENPWPPTPQEILESNSDTNQDLINLISWIVYPKGKLDKNGDVNVPKTKKTKIFHAANNIESMLPNTSPSLDQILFSETLHAKTGSKDVVDTVHALGYGISHTDLYFIQDKWAEWAESQSSIIPNNIKKGEIVTHIADNIDFKNKSIDGKETHNTNSILVQQQNTTTNVASKVSLQADYAFERKNHRAFKAKQQELPFYTGRKKVDPIVLSPIMTNDNDDFNQSTMINQAWVACRLRNEIDENAQIPAWSSFRKMTTQEESKKIEVGYLPPILGSPTKMSVVLEIMHRSIKVMRELELEYIFLVCDQAIYAKVLEVLFDYEDQGNDTFRGLIVRMGGFHVQMCLMKCIYSRYKECGLVRLLSENGIGSEGTISSALNAGDVKFGIRYYKILYEAFMRSKMKEAGLPKIENEMNYIFTEEITPTQMKNIVDNIKYLPTFSGKMAEWINSFLDMVNLLLNIIHFQRVGNWEGYLFCLEEFLPWCFALNRHNYARDLSYYLVHMRKLKTDNPDAYNYLIEGGFSGSLSGEKHTQIPMDQIIETTINRSNKEVGGIIGKTENESASEKWVRLSHILAALKEFQNKKIHKTSKKCKHVELGTKRLAKDEDDVRRVVDGITIWCPNLWRNSPLVHLSDGVLASEEMVNNVFLAKTNGKAAMEDFISRFTTNNHILKFYNPITRQKVHSFQGSNVKQKKENNIPEDECESFGNALSVFDGEKLDLKYLMNWCVTTRPWMICKEYGESRDPNKSLFRNNLLKENPNKATNTVPSDISCCIVDGGRIIRLIGISDLKGGTFLSWADRIIEYLRMLPGQTVHVVFDNYEQNDDLILSKGRKKIGQPRLLNHLSQKLPSPSEWSDFLSLDQNKQQVIALLCNHILTTLNEKCTFVTNGKKCFVSALDSVLTEVTELFSTHREADPRILIHAAYEDSKQQEGICIVADDTDILIMLLYVGEIFSQKLYLREGVSKSKEGVRYHDITSLQINLGPEICDILPGFHALTGCDYTRPFYGRSKFAIFKKVLKNTDLCKLLTSLSSQSIDLYDLLMYFVLHVIYGRDVSEKTPGESRYAMLFVNKKGKKRRFIDTRRIAPDYLTMEQKFKRANYVTLGMVNCLDPTYINPNPLLYGWEIGKDNQLNPVWYKGNPLPTIKELQAHTRNNAELIEISAENSSNSENEQ